MNTPKRTWRAWASAVAVALQLGAIDACWAGGSEPILGEIMWVPYAFVPKNWAACNGQLLPVQQNTALFALLGTTYGGNGTTTFALPNMQGRVPVQAGQGPGLSPYSLGQSGGEATHTLTVAEMPAHSHAIQVSTQTATFTDPTNHVLAAAPTGNLYSTSSDGTLATGALTTVGGGQPHNNMMPYTTLRCIIALQGIFPAHP